MPLPMYARWCRAGSDSELSLVGVAGRSASSLVVSRFHICILVVRPSKQQTVLRIVSDPGGVGFFGSAGSRDGITEEIVRAVLQKVRDITANGMSDSAVRVYKS
jgi:hypothetical protein